MNITLLDPSIHSANVGDQIIRQEVDAALRGLLEVGEVLPTQRPLTKRQRTIADDSDLAIVGGTNLLSSNMPWYRQWKIDPLSARSLKNKVVLMGVGWWQYQEEPNAYTRWLLGTVLSRDHVHSVRDEYTKNRLTKLGFDVVNTACPTMWNLTSVSPQGGARASTCIVTLTDYNRDREEDQWLIDLVSSLYDQVLIWAQSARDVEYAGSLKGDFAVIEPTLAAYQEALSATHVDYIGTRLHGGIRAFNSGAWGIIVAVDNRAIEIGKDTGLPVFARGDRKHIEEAVKQRAAHGVRLPVENIQRWVSQFA